MRHSCNIVWHGNCNSFNAIDGQWFFIWTDFDWTSDTRPHDLRARICFHWRVKAISDLETSIFYLLANMCIRSFVLSIINNLKQLMICIKSHSGDKMVFLLHLPMDNDRTGSNRIESLFWRICDFIPSYFIYRLLNSNENQNENEKNIDDVCSNILLS